MLGDSTQDEIEMLKAQMTLEKQSIQRLHVQLRDLSKENSKKLVRQEHTLDSSSSSKPGLTEESLSNVKLSLGDQYSEEEAKENITYDDVPINV